MRTLIALGLLVAASSPALALDVVAPHGDGLVLGATLEVEVHAPSAPASLVLDGVAVVPSGGWTALPYAEHWLARVPLAATGKHVLHVVASNGGTTVVSFESTKGGSVAIGDEVVRHFLAAHPTTSLAWDWGPGVFLYGLHRFAHVSPERASDLAAIEAYYAHHLAKGLPTIDHPDVCAPALAALGLARRDGVTSALPAAKKVRDYLATEKRDALGAIDHLGSHSLLRTLALASGVFSAWAHSIWCDSLMMYGVFSAQWGAAESEPALLDFGAQQPAIFASVLQDPVTGLFTHAWDLKTARPLGVRWLRGNGWVATSTLDILDELPASSPRRAALERLFKELATGLAAKQQASGLWDSVADRPGDSYAEASGSALAAYALAKGERLGLAPKGSRARARHAFEAIVERMRRRTDGLSVEGTSGATDPAPEWVYTLIPRVEDKDYGVGAVLLLAEELSTDTW